MAFLETPLLHHFTPTICTSLSYFYSVCFVFSWYFAFFIFLHWLSMIDYTLKVKYFVWDIFELNWNSYPPILPSSLYLSSFSCPAFASCIQTRNCLHIPWFSLFQWYFPVTRQSFIAFGVTFDDQCEHCGGSNQVAHYWKSSPAPPNHRHPFFLQSLQDQTLSLLLILNFQNILISCSIYIWANTSLFNFSLCADQLWDIFFCLPAFPPFQIFHVSSQLFASTLQFFSQALFSQLLCLSYLYAPFQYHSNVSFNCEVNKYFW